MKTKCVFALFVLLGVSLPQYVQAQAKKVDAKEIQQSVRRAHAWLKSVQADDGSFAKRRAGPGISALVVAALLRNGYDRKDPVVAKTLDYLTKQVQKDGGIYNRFLANYTTCVAMMALKEANTDGKYDAILKKAASFVKTLQHQAPESGSGDAKHGGFGYDKGGRPDLSNSIFSVEALLAVGVSKDDPAIKRALIFIGRCQNLPGEDNPLPFAKKATKEDRGGLTYTPFVSDKNQYATPAGGLRSLGGMTYGGLKSFLYAGVGKKDDRVKAAVDWIRRHYTVKENPGMGKGGLFYYYHTFGKAMDALGEEEFTDAKGNKHHWRTELAQQLLSMQNKNGSWVNRNRAFGEGTPELATAFAVLSLSYCKGK